MRFVQKTFVPYSVDVVKEKFDRQLFESLAPPFPRMKLLRFDGSKLGDEVHIELDFFLHKTTWVSVITESQTTETGFYFVDEGTKLPAFFSYWRHQHILSSHQQGTIITDDVEFRVKPVLLSPFLFVGTWFQFLYRKPIYKRYKWGV